MSKKKPVIPLAKKHVAVGNYPGLTQTGINSSTMANRRKYIKVVLPELDFIKKSVPEEGD